MHTHTDTLINTFEHIQGGCKQTQIQTRSRTHAHIQGGRIDIHCGGEDLKFPHHDNEIAQSVVSALRPTHTCMYACASYAHIVAVYLDLHVHACIRILHAFMPCTECGKYNIYACIRILHACMPRAECSKCTQTYTTCLHTHCWFFKAYHGRGEAC